MKGIGSMGTVVREVLQLYWFAVDTYPLLTVLVTIFLWQRC